MTEQISLLMRVMLSTASASLLSICLLLKWRLRLLLLLLGVMRTISGLVMMVVMVGRVRTL